MSKTVTIPGCNKRPAAWASWKNRSRYSRCSSGLCPVREIVLTATNRSILGSRAQLIDHAHGSATYLSNDLVAPETLTPPSFHLIPDLLFSTENATSILVAAARNRTPRDPRLVVTVVTGLTNLCVIITGIMATLRRNQQSYATCTFLQFSRRTYGELGSNGEAVESRTRPGTGTVSKIERCLASVCRRLYRINQAQIQA